MIRRLLNLRTLAVVLVLVVIVGLGWLWYRGSSLVKIKHVTVTGLSGPDVKQIRSALTQSALTMTTLNLNMTKLESSVEAYPVVSTLTATTHGSHAVTIGVVETIPVADLAGQYLDSSGHVLPNSTVTHGSLPTLKLPVTAQAGRVTGTDVHAVLTVLAAAPYAFLPHLSSATHTAGNGVVVQVTNGPKIYFGSSVDIKAKWTAALAVIASPSSAGASYITVVDPQRAAAGSGKGTG